MSCPFCVRVGVSPDAPLKVLWSEFTQAEAKSIAAAGELRSAISELGDKHPTIIKLRNKLEAEVKAAFTFRHRFQKAEAEQLRRQLAEIESKLTSREKNQDAIIKKRVEDLIRADELEWEAIVARRKADASLASSANQPSSAGQTPKRTKDVEKEEVWKRVNRPEYIYAGVDIQPSGFVGGRGGWRPGLPFAPGWFPSPGASQPSVEFLHGTLIRGHAIIPTVWGYDAVWGHDGRRSYIISIGDQQLPCRLAGVAPKQMLAFHSQRFPAEGIADLSHEAADGQSVWAFLPDRPETLVKANVFRKAGGDFEFNEEVAFAIQARGAIDGGYLVCADNGDFLGIVLYQIGSLDACLSAKSINDWFRQEKLDPPILSDPYAAIVDVRPSTETPFGAFTGFVINGVIVTRSLPLDAKFTIKKFDDGRKLTPLRCANSKDGKLGFIWCEELK